MLQISHVTTSYASDMQMHRTLRNTGNQQCSWQSSVQVSDTAVHQCAHNAINAGTRAPRETPPVNAVVTKDPR